MPTGLEIRDANGILVFNADTHRPLKYVKELYPTNYQFYGGFCNIYYFVPPEYRSNKFMVHMVNSNLLVRGSSADANGSIKDNINYDSRFYTQDQLKQALKPALILSM